MGTEPTSASKIIEVPEFELRALRREIKKLKRENAELKDGVTLFSEEVDKNYRKTEWIIGRYRTIYGRNLKSNRTIEEMEKQIARLKADAAAMSGELEKRDSLEAHLRKRIGAGKRNTWLLLAVTVALSMGYAVEYRASLAECVRLGMERLRCTSSSSERLVHWCIK